MAWQALQVFECVACAHRVYPARLRCPKCGMVDSQEISVQQGCVRAWTSLAQADGASIVIATVWVEPDGPELVVRLAQEPAQPGQRVALQARTLNGRLLPWGDGGIE